MQADSIIETHRLFLRPYREEDFEAIYAFRSDLRVFFWERSPPVRAACRADFDRTRLLFAQRGLGHRAVFEKSGRFVGQAGLRPAPLADEIELAYHISFDAWNQGYATEAAAALIAYGFDALALPRIVADVLPTNTRSLRVIEKLGMEPAGERLHAGFLHRYFVLTHEAYFARNNELRSNRGEAS
jgi:RimJ/RimL family protein N-acetyltransferase